MLQTGEPDNVLNERLERAYYKLTATTHRHFQKDGQGWFLTGVAGLDAPTMNRAVVDTAPAVEVGKVLQEAATFFGERECSWGVVLSSFRPARDWHGELVLRGCAPTSTLDVLTRAPGPMLGSVPDISVRLARADETARFTEIIMDVFRMPRRFYPALLDMTDAWRGAGARLYFAEQDGEPVATALMAIVDGIAGIYNVATLRQARRQGHAKALMAKCFEDAASADIITLQVAPEGFVEPFYLGLGFEPQYRWRFYSPRSR